MPANTNKKRKSGNRSFKTDADSWRFTAVKAGIYVAALVIFARLVQVQVFNHDVYETMAREQYLREYKQPAPRGLIRDRHATLLAVNKERYDLGVHNRSVAAPAELSHKLASVLQSPADVILNKLETGNRFTVLLRDIREDRAEMLKAMNLRGVKVTKTAERLYPFKESLAQVIGFADVDGRGLSGLELQFDSELRGKDGWSMMQQDARGQGIIPIASMTQGSQQGDDLILTIDHVLQTIAEEELVRAVKKYHAKGGTAIISNPATGEVLALASYPGFDANLAGKTPADSWRIRGITDIFEPGSTFKIVTMMQALRDSIMRPDDIIFCENGKYHLHGETINDPEPHAWLSFEQVFKHSSNIGAAKIAMKLGREKLFRAARDLGFGNKTGIDLPGEVSGILKKPSEWSKFTIAAMAYGHEVAVTAMQMAMAYGAVANGGLLMKPAIVKQIVSQTGEIRSEFKPRVIRKVMDARVAAEMTRILTQVVEDGTGTMARIPGIHIAGKTGTAQKPRPGRGGYSNSDFVASFIAFYPAEHARLLFYVSLDEPYPIHSGGHVAAPTVRKILERILKIYHPRKREQTQQVATISPSARPTIPNLSGRRVEVAERTLEDLGIEYTVEGQGTYVEGQAINRQHRSDRVVLELRPVDKDSAFSSMPNLVGLSLRKAIVELTARGLTAKIEGSGLVMAQQPATGSRMKPGSRGYIRCEPPAAARHLLNP